MHALGSVCAGEARVAASFSDQSIGRNGSFCSPVSSRRKIMMAGALPRSTFWYQCQRTTLIVMQEIRDRLRHGRWLASRFRAELISQRHVTWFLFLPFSSFFSTVRMFSHSMMHSIMPNNSILVSNESQSTLSSTQFNHWYSSQNPRHLATSPVDWVHSY